MSTKTILAGLAFACASLYSTAALPCGGMFGPNATVDPSQTLLVSHKAGTETYVFRPHFCGASTQFGLILPVPSSLTKSPTLGDPALFTELDRLSAPEVVKKTVCKGDPLDAGGAGFGQTDNGSSKGADVIDKGQVGIFDWALVKADSKDSFTQWLDTNGFPHAPDADTQFAHYVDEGWYFVAFKVTAGADAPPAGKKLCGDFGPIELAFPTATPVVPTRMAAVSAGGRSPAWRIYGLTGSGLQLGVTAAKYPAMLSFSDELSAASLASAPQLAKLGVAGDRLVRLEVGFGFDGLAKDLELTPAAPQKTRSTREEITYVDCPTTTPTDPNANPSLGTPVGSSGAPAGSASSGCGVANTGSGSGVVALGAALALALVAARRRR